MSNGKFQMSNEGRGMDGGQRVTLATPIFALTYTAPFTETRTPLFPLFDT